MMFHVFWDARNFSIKIWVRHVCDRMVVGFTTTCAISAHHHYSCEFKPRSWRYVLDTKHYLIKFVSDLRHVGCFLRELIKPPRYNCNIVESSIKHHKRHQTIKEIKSEMLN